MKRFWNSELYILVQDYNKFNYQHNLGQTRQLSSIVSVLSCPIIIIITSTQIHLEELTNKLLTNKIICLYLTLQEKSASVNNLFIFNLKF